MMAGQAIQKITARVKVFFPDRGFGFLETEDLGDVFFHVKRFEGRAAAPSQVQEGQRLAFHPVPSAKKAGTYEARAIEWAAAGEPSQRPHQAARPGRSG